MRMKDMLLSLLLNLLINILQIYSVDHFEEDREWSLCRKAATSAEEVSGMPLFT